MRNLLPAAFLAVLLACPAAAQTTTPQRVAMRQVDTTPAEQPSAAHLQAAADVLDAMDMEQSLARSIDATIEMQVSRDPQLERYEDVLRRFFTRWMSWARLRDDYARIYADHFTADELRQIAAFYRSPAGQRLAASTPDLMRESAALGQKAVEGHMDELRAMIAAEARRQPNAAKP
ncbi:MAG TPA: DUF2059 domain-containing protein [Longimicrobiaceae bacterium]|jgi:hypothetical protein|nr:DUF2059 domain-containing protein [Longimicrobiaceae bacterium]